MLRDAAKISGDKVDEITLRLLGSYELLLEDYAAAEKAWAHARQQGPEEQGDAVQPAWWAYSLLKQFKNAEALAVVKDETLSDKQPELAYATAWAKWRTNDDAGAWNAIVVARQGLGQRRGQGSARRDVYMFAGRSNVSLAEITPQMFTLFGAKQKGQQYAVLVEARPQVVQLRRPLGRRRRRARQGDRRSRATRSRSTTSRCIRYQQADFTVRLDTPDVAAKYALEALKAIPPCGTKCSEQDKQDLTYGVFGIGPPVPRALRDGERRPLLPAGARSLHGDGRHPDGRREARRGAEEPRHARADAEEHEGRHRHARQGRDRRRCSTATTRKSRPATRRRSRRTRSSAARVTVNLEADATGAIKGVSTEPKSGLADLSAVAGCVERGREDLEAAEARHAGHDADQARLRDVAAQVATRGQVTARSRRLRTASLTASLLAACARLLRRRARRRRRRLVPVTRAVRSSSAIIRSARGDAAGLIGIRVEARR